MKEITRIHIAKIPYDAELAAKKELEAYLKTLEAYSADAEIIDDIEIRMTEILAERGVARGGVISEADVASLKQQLGEPRDFMGDEEMAIGADDERVINAEPSRKLYRDTDRAVVGGVMAGIAAFFKINPLWVRLIFIVVALASSGTALVVYVVLWIAVPPAATVADKLQMAGRAVTINSIREMTEREIGRPEGRGIKTRRVLIILLGIACALGALGAAIVTVLAGLVMPLRGRFHLYDVVIHSPFLLSAFILALISGLLLVTMFVLGAYASFAQKMSRRVLVSICVVIVLGLASFGTAIGLMQYGYIQTRQIIEANTVTKSLQLPVGMDKISGLKVESTGVAVYYSADYDNPSADLTVTTDEKQKVPKINLEIKDGVLIVSGDWKYDNCTALYGCVDQPTLQISGPALTTLDAGTSANVQYLARSQPKLQITAIDGATVSLGTGQIDTLVAKTTNADVRVNAATVRHLDVSLQQSGSVSAGYVQSLAVTSPTACPGEGSATQVDVLGVSAGHMTINGAEQSADSITSGCAAVTIEGEKNL